jgi:hypothetical protein
MTYGGRAAGPPRWPDARGARDARVGTVGGVTGDHPLAGLLAAAAAGRHSVANGNWRRVPPWRPGVEAIVAFTGHAVLAVAPDIPDRRLVSLGVDGLGGAHDPRLITALGGPGGWIDSLDILVAGCGATTLTRSRRHYPAHGDTTATMTVQAQ